MLTVQNSSDEEIRPMTPVSLTDDLLAAAVKGYELELSRIETAIADLREKLGHGAQPASRASEPRPRTRRFSAATRKKMAAAQRLRWKKVNQTAEQPQKEAAKPKRKMSASARKRIAAAQRKRWAAVKKASAAAKKAPAKKVAAKKVAVKKAAAKAPVKTPKPAKKAAMKKVAEAPTQPVAGVA
jgi:hypothetical protein